MSKSINPPVTAALSAKAQNSESAPLIALEGVSMSWDNKLILNNINLDIRRNDFIAVTGPNGGGKTTLLRIILKLLEPTSGKVRYFGADGQPSDRLSIGYLPQKNMIDAKFPVTVSEVISSGLIGNKELTKEQRRAKVADTLRLVDLVSHAGHPIGELSGGQLQRTLLGRALISSPEILVLDEPLSYIDKHFEKKLYSIMRELAATKTIILVSHEMSVIAGMATRHLIVDHNIHECAGHHHFIPSDCV